MLSVAEKAAQIMEHLCEHAAHGYSQPNRAGIGTGGGEGETVTLSDGSKVQISTGDRDCSSAVIECFAAQGIDCGGAYSTHDMEDCMLSSGNFEKLPATTWKAPKRGDILLAPGVHTALALGNGEIGEAARSETGSTHGALGDQDGWEVRVADLYDDDWTCVLRYCGEGAEGDDEDMIAEGFGGRWECQADGCRVRTEPRLSGEVVAFYNKGQTVVLDDWIGVADGYLWGRYTGGESGKKRYIAVAKLEHSELWDR